MGCLDGLLVIDLGRRYPPAYISMILADFGAKVVKVDPPAHANRRPTRDTPEEKFAAYSAIDRNKLSIVLDLKDYNAREVFLRLVKRADVLVASMRPGVMDRLRLGYSHLSQNNPRLIYCSLTGYGPDGPYADIPSHDFNYIAVAGALSLIGERDGQPYFPSNMVADMGGAALHGALGILLALMAREKTGRGQLVDISYVDAVLSQLVFSISEYFETAKVPKRGETDWTGGAPWAQAFRCKDGQYFTIGAAEKHLWENLCQALGRPDLIADREPVGRERSDQVIAELRKIFATRNRDEWWELLKDKDTCVGPVYNLDEALRDPQVLHRQMVVDIEHHSLGTVKQMGVPIKLSDTPGTIRRLGVPTGTDTTSVLAELGYSDAEIEDLRRGGALG